MSKLMTDDEFYKAYMNQYKAQSKVYSITDGPYSPEQVKTMRAAYETAKLEQDWSDNRLVKEIVRDQRDFTIEQVNKQAEGFYNFLQDPDLPDHSFTYQGVTYENITKSQLKQLIQHNSDLVDVFFEAIKQSKKKTGHNFAYYAGSPDDD